MEWVETTGSTVEEAKEAALDQLGVDEQDAEFETLAEPKHGLFGRLREEARVRARVRPTSPRAKDDRRDRRRRKRTNDDAATDSAVAVDDRADHAAETHNGAGIAPSSDEVGGRNGNASAPVASREDPQSASAGEVSSAGSGEAPSGRRGAGRRASSAGSETGEHEVPLERQAAAATAFLEGLLGAFDLQGSVQHQQLDEDTVEVSVTGEDLGALIGPKGSTLNAVQDLARIAVQRDTGARTGRLHVDISGYRKRRQEALAQFTAKVAAEVVESGRRRVLEPMNSADRKVVHDTVNSIAGVSSVSQGEDPDRRVVLIADPD